MKLFLFFCVIVISLFTISISALSPGMITSISTSEINQVANQVLPYAIQLIKEFPIDDISQSHMHISSIRIPNLSLQEFALTTSDKGVHLNLRKLHVNIQAHFKYKQGILRFSGNVNGSATGSAALSVKLVPKADRFVIDLTQADVNVSDFSLHISGGLIAKLLNIVKSLFNSLIKKMVKSKLSSAISEAIRTVASQFADFIPTSAAYGPFALSLAPASFGARYDANTVSVAFDANINHSEVPRHDIDQTFVPSGALFDIFLDVFTFNSGLASIPFKTLIYTAEHPGVLPVPGWKCSNWHSLIPIMDDPRFRDLDVKIELNLKEAPVMQSQGGVLSLTVFGEYSFFCGDTLMTKLRADIGGGVSVSLDKKEDGNQYITPQFHQVGAKFTVEWTLDGMIFPVVGVLEAIFNVATHLVTEVVNSLMLNGILVPSVMGLELVNPRIDFPTNAIRFQTDISYSPPAAWLSCP